MNSNKKKIKVIILMNFLVIVSIFNFINIANYSNECETSVESKITNLMLSGSSINIMSPVELTYIEPMSGYYPATLGFENDKDGSIPERWDTWVSGGNPQPETIALLDSHNKVLQIHDQSASGQTSVYQVFEGNKSSGTIEIWFYITDITQRTRLYGRNSTQDYSFHFRVESSKWEYNNGSTWKDIPNIPIPENNNWTHIRIDFECGSEGYLGLESDEYIISIDGISSGPLPFENQMFEIENFGLCSGVAATDYYFYIDAVGYSWDPNYEIGENFDEGLLLSFDINKEFNWIGYSLDDQANVTILGNKTIPMPAHGVHCLQVFGNDTLGEIYQSDIRFFAINYEGSPIHIDGTDILKDWYYIAYFYEWCSGSGCLNNPYKIENLNLEGEGFDIGILVNNSREFFMIKNCNISNFEIGIKIENCTNVAIAESNINNIKGINGDNGGTGENGETGTGAIGINIITTSNISLSSNNISKIYGGNGGNGGNGGDYQEGGHGGHGGDAYGILVRSSYEIELQYNNFSFIFGGYGGNGGNGGAGIWYGDDGSRGGNGGSGGSSYAIYSEFCGNVTADSNYIYCITGNYGGKGGAGSNGENGIGMPPPLPSYDGGDGGFGGFGNNGGSSSGFHYIYTLNISNLENRIYLITGADGGLGGKGGNGGIGNGEPNGEAGVGGNGGDGGNSAGFYFEECIDIRNKLNLIINISAGNGADGGDAGDYFYDRYGGGGGDGGWGSGCYLMKSSKINMKDNILQKIEYGLGGFVGLWDFPNPYYSDGVDGQASGFTVKQVNQSFINLNSITNCQYGLYLLKTINSTLSENKINESHNDGIYLYDSCEYIKINKNNISSNGKNGIAFSSHCNNNTINYNLIYGNNESGIRLYNQCFDNVISKNKIFDNKDQGIFLRDSNDNNRILECSIEFNNIGIELRNSEQNFLSDNKIFNNTAYGILLNTDSINNTIFKNTLMGNNQSGITLVASAQTNSIYFNYFILNRENALDDGYNTFWDNDTIGNYWDDYCGIDLNGDDIGDSPYIVPSSTPGNNIDYYPICNIPPAIIKVEILSSNFTVTSFKVQLFIFNYLNEGIENCTIHMWWNGTDLSSNIQDLGAGLYSISLEPIYVLPGSNGILLNMSIEVDGYPSYYYETFITVEQTIKEKLLFVEIIDQIFLFGEFNITFSVNNESKHGIDFALIQIWWNGVDKSIDVENLGGGIYFISLEPLTVAPGEDPILLNMTITANGYQIKYYEIYLAVEPCEIIRLLQIDILEQLFSLNEFNISFSVSNETGQGIDFATIQIWWNGTEASDNIQNLGGGIYFISLESITVASGEDPILLNMTITADGYQDKYFQNHIAVDPDTLQKIPTDGMKKGVSPLLLIFIVFILSIGIAIGIGLIIWIKRRKLEIK